MRWNVDPVIIKFGILSIRYYGLMFVLGFIIMGEYGKRLFIKHGKEPGLISSLSTYIIVGMMVGARLGHCIFYEPELLLSNPLSVFKIWEGGLASHGGYLGVGIAVWYFFKKNKGLQYLWITDLIVGPTLFVGGLIRVGNLFNSEIYGEPTSVPWSVIFERVDNIPRHPTQVYEAIGYFTISFIIMFIVSRKFDQWRRGNILGLAIIMSFTFRFLIELLKGEQSTLSANLPINMGQILSLLWIIGAAIFMMKINKRPVTVNSVTDIKFKKLKGKPHR